MSKGKLPEDLKHEHDALMQKAFAEYEIAVSEKCKEQKDIIRIENLEKEFLIKCQWFQYYSEKKLGTKDVWMVTSSLAVNNPKAADFSIETSGKLWDGFMHFLVANEKNPVMLGTFMDEWQKDGRELDEKDASGIAPVHVSVYTNNYDSFSALCKKGVDITAVDCDGLAPIHTIIQKIANGTGELNFLKKWIEDDLPTDALTGKAAGANAGKTPLEFAVSIGSNELALIMAKKGGIGVAKTDNGLNILNHCISENNMALLEMIAEDTELKVAELVTPERTYSSSSLPYTPLLQAVVEGKTDIVVKLAQAGVGTTTLDNTNHVLNYVGNFGGDKTLEMLEVLKEAEIDVSDEKAEQALVYLVHNAINPDAAKILIEMGVKTEGVLELFAENGLTDAIEAINKIVAEINSPSLEEEVEANSLEAIVAPHMSTDSLEVVVGDLLGDISDA